MATICQASRTSWLPVLREQGNSYGIKGETQKRVDSPVFSSSWFIIVIPEGRRIPCAVPGWTEPRVLVASPVPWLSSGACGQGTVIGTNFSFTFNINFRGVIKLKGFV